MTVLSNQVEYGALAHRNGRIAALLSRYPNVSGREAGEIVEFIRLARPAEIGRLAQTDALRSQFDRFVKDNRHRL